MGEGHLDGARSVGICIGKLGVNAWGVKDSEV